MPALRVLCAKKLQKCLGEGGITEIHPSAERDTSEWEEAGSAQFLSVPRAFSLLSFSQLLPPNVASGSIPIFHLPRCRGRQIRVTPFLSRLLTLLEN